MKAKNKYRIRNWSQYNKSLIKRGSISVWFSDEAIREWTTDSTGKRGRPTIYSDHAIMTALMIKAVFHLSLRALEGFLQSLSLIMGISLPIPS